MHVRREKTTRCWFVIPSSHVDEARFVILGVTYTRAVARVRSPSGGTLPNHPPGVESPLGGNRICSDSALSEGGLHVPMGIIQWVAHACTGGDGRREVIHATGAQAVAVNRCRACRGIVCRGL